METEFLLKHNDLSIPCVLSEPEYGSIQRIVLGVHGIIGSSRDPIQESISEEMSLFGSVTLRFDFPCHGQSPMTDEHFTLKNCMDSLITVATWARERYPDVEDLCIFATGFGAYVTLVSLYELIELPGRIKLVVQTPSVMMHDTLLAMKKISRVTFEAMGSISFGRTKPITVTYSFYKELLDHIAMAAYPIPILILQGEADDFIRMEDIQNFHRINERSKLVIIPGTSHRFLEEGAWDMVLDLTRDWFEFEQVLLSDWF